MIRFGIAIVLLAMVAGCGDGIVPAIEGRVVVETAALDEVVGTNCVGIPPWAKAHLKVMPIGDSITAGSSQGATYRTSLATMTNRHPSLQAVGFVGSQGMPAPCCHDGHPGWTTERIAASAMGWVEVWRPDVILLLVGTNDADPDAAVAIYVSKIIDPILAAYPGTSILAAPLIYRAENDAGRQAFNAGLRGALRNHPFLDARIWMVDAMAGAVTPGPDFDQADGTNDGLHPGPRGAEKMAAVWYQAGMGRFW